MSLLRFFSSMEITVSQIRFDFLGIYLVKLYGHTLLSNITLCLGNINVFAVFTGAGNDVSRITYINTTLRLDFYIFKGYGIRPVIAGPLPIYIPINRFAFALESREVLNIFRAIVGIAGQSVFFKGEDNSRIRTGRVGVLGSLYIIEDGFGRSLRGGD